MSIRKTGSALILLGLSLAANAANSVLSLSHYDEPSLDFDVISEDIDCHKPV